MPKITKSKPVKKVVKQKLSKEQRSQIARDRWAKIKAGKATQEATTRIVNSILETKPVEQEPEFTPDPPTGRDENGVPPVVGLGDGTIMPNGVFIPTSSPVPPEIAVAPVVNLVESPAPQLAPVKTPKQKRTPVPKEFSAALKTADQLLAKAIEEYEECQTRISYLEKAIPRLQRTVSALRNESNPDAVSAPQAFQLPTSRQDSRNPLAAIQAAMDAAAQPPVFKASGGAVQLSPDVVGTLEGPEDDDSDIDRFITGPAAGGGGWIGG